MDFQDFKRTGIATRGKYYLACQELKIL